MYLHLIEPKKVAPNAKSCSKDAEHIRDMPNYGSEFGDEAKGCA